MADRVSSPGDPVLIASQGSFAAGGTVVSTPGSFDPENPSDPAGQTLHGDHVRVSYQIPPRARPLPLVLWHGYGEGAATFDTTPDGREGFRTIFLRRRYAVFTLDQPRRANAGRTTVAAQIPTATDEGMWFTQFRFGVWPRLFEGVQFPDDPEAFEQFFRLMVPDTGPIDTEVIVSGASAAFDRIGPCTMVMHSHAGGFAWLTAIRNRNVRAVIGLEPGSGFVFPENEVPPTLDCATGPLAGVGIPEEDFRRLTEIPVVIYYGDNIPAEPDRVAGLDNWRVRWQMAQSFVEAINRHGGDAQLISLPERGIHGNTHFLFSDLNNVEIADELEAFLADNQLD
jgi:pimeloyl-ACP methyl ester carboxylesterase